MRGIMMVSGQPMRSRRLGRGHNVKQRTGEPWMAADVYGRSLRGFGVNLVVRNVARAVAFCRQVLGAGVVYSDADFAVLRRGEVEWMLHADHTYAKHPLYEALRGDLPRGLGAELRLHGCDPDAAQQAARAGGFTVLAAVADKPHGLRECYLLDPDGYLWVPDVPLPRAPAGQLNDGGAGSSPRASPGPR